MRRTNLTGAHAAPAFLKLALSAVLLLTACGSQPITVTREPVIIRLSTSESCGPIAMQLASAYEEAKPWVSIRIDTLNTAAAEASLRSGAIDLAMLSQVDDDEQSLWQVPFASDGVIVIVHPQVPITEISTDQLREIFRGRIGEWEDGTRIQVVSRESGSGQRAAFEDSVMEGRQVTLTAVVMPSSQRVADYVAATPGAIGYTSLAWLTERIHALPLDGVPPVPAAWNRYPHTYPQLLVTAPVPEGEIRAFIQWVLGQEGQALVMQTLAPLMRD